MEELSNTDLFENILQGITDPVLLLTKDLKILWANKSFQNQTSYTREEIIGNHCFKITHRNESPCVSPDDLCPVSESIKTGETATTTHTHYDKEGKKIFVEVSAYPVKDTNGEIVQFAYILRDLTEKMIAAESCIHATNALLKLYIRKSSRKEYLDSVVELIRDWSGCYYVGIRVLNTYGNVPFESYIGYSKKFWDSENWLSVKEDQCACIRVIQGKPELQDLPAITPGGSFRLNNANEFFSALPEEEMGRFRGVCLQSGFKSIAIIPIRYQESVIGAIHVADEKEGMVPLKTVEFIESISPLIGEAVHRFSTEEELVKYQQHLEELVEERTAMLRAATEKLQQEITERKIAAEGLETRVKERTSELEKANIELRRLSAHLQSVREQERTNIARDIHDELGQVLTALKIEVSMFANKLHPDDKFFDKTESIIKKIDDTIQSVKRICAELRPTILDHFGLSAAIEWHIEEFENRTGIKCNVSLEPREIILDQDLTTSVFRIFQEALTNVVRHADASEVRVTLRLKDGKIMLEIKDNGKGITKKHFLDSQSFGIMGIRERVNFFGGNVKITGIKDKGTTIMVSIPLKKKDVP